MTVCKWYVSEITEDDITGYTAINTLYTVSSMYILYIQQYICNYDSDACFRFVITRLQFMVTIILIFLNVIVGSALDN